MPFAALQADPLNHGPPDLGPAPVPVDNFQAFGLNFDNERNVNAIGARAEATRAALWDRHAQIEQLTGHVLRPSDTMTSGPNEGALSFGPLIGGVARAAQAGEALLGLGHPDDQYEAQVEKLRAENPVAFQAVPTRQLIEDRLAARWNLSASQAAEGAAQHPVAAFLGGSAAGLAEPGNLALLATGPLGGGRLLATRMLLQGVEQAGVTAAEAPLKINEAQTFGGPAYTPEQAGQDVLGAALGGAAFELGGHVIGHYVAAPVLRALFPDRDLYAASAGIPGEPADPAATARAGQVVEAAHRDDLAIGPASGADHAEATAALDNHELPPLEPARDLPEIVPDSPDGSLRAADYRGRTIYSGVFDARQVAADPLRFQYKASGDAEGLTGRLAGVDAWDATAAGKVIVWEDAAGNRFIADGHQRRGLALAMEAKGWDAPLDGYLFREADGWSPADVRTVAALKNIREGSGSPLDAAKVLRDTPAAINDRSLPLSGEFMGQARGLALLSDPAFRAVVNHVIPERYGAEIGLGAAARPDLHEPMVRLIKDAEPANADEARALVVEALTDDWVKREGDQADLFGYDPSVSAMIARAKIAASVKRSLSRDTRLFSALIRHADAIEAGGNALARDQNEARLAVDRAALELTSKLALRSGPVGEAMRGAVEKVHAGETPAAAARDVLARVREAIAAGEDLSAERKAAIAPDPPTQAQGEALKPFDDPAGPGAAEQAREAPEDANLPAEHPGLFDDLAKADDGAAERYDQAHQLLATCAPAGE